MQIHRGSIPEHTDLWQSYCLKGVCVCVLIYVTGHACNHGSAYLYSETAYLTPSIPVQPQPPVTTANIYIHIAKPARQYSANHIHIHPEHMIVISARRMQSKRYIGLLNTSSTILTVCSTCFKITALCLLVCVCFDFCNKRRLFSCTAFIMRSHFVLCEL